jgi:hypothetical protein
MMTDRMYKDVKTTSTEEFKKRMKAMGFKSYLFIGVDEDSQETDCLIHWQDMEKVHFEFREMLLRDDGKYLKPLSFMVDTLMRAVAEAQTLLSVSKAIEN